ncbi:MAG: dipicolinate synthase subunit B [Clostridia bacterium]
MKIGLCVTGSFCTLKNLLLAVDDLVAAGFDITPIFSFNVSELDTRFGTAEDFCKKIVEKTGKKPITTIVDAEPIGTSAGLELMLVAPCTGNTLAKIAHGITDTPVTMAVKATLRNNRPVVLSISSNDALGANGKNFGHLINAKNIYFVPLGQDSPKNKSNSLIADTKLILPTCLLALQNKQLEPVLI